MSGRGAGSKTDGPGRRGGRPAALGRVSRNLCSSLGGHRSAGRYTPTVSVATESLLLETCREGREAGGGEGTGVGVIYIQIAKKNRQREPQPVGGARWLRGTAATMLCLENEPEGSPETLSKKHPFSLMLIPKRCASRRARSQLPRVGGRDQKGAAAAHHRIVYVATSASSLCLQRTASLVGATHRVGGNTFALVRRPTASRRWRTIQTATCSTRRRARSGPSTRRRDR